VRSSSNQKLTSPYSLQAVKSLAESLAHDLIPTKVSAHLLVPGYTYTKLTTGGGADAKVDASKKPEAAWSAAQVAEELFSRLDEFYIICPDSESLFF
jgi:short-subunit dehydrogenase